MTECMASGLKTHFPALLFLALAAVAAYAPSLGHDFIPLWDDGAYIIANTTVHGFSPDNLRTAFTAYYAGNYAPLHIVSYMLDYSLWGLDPRGYILTNILLHTANGLLFYALLVRSGLSRAAATAAAFIFLLHPVQVESVAWISQRKNVLAMFFFLAAFHAYLAYREQDSPKKRHSCYALSTACFICALMSKSAAIILPISLFLHDLAFLPKERRRWWLADKLPYLLIAVAFALITLKSQTYQEGWGGRTAYHGGSPLATFYTMLPVLARYLGLLFWPTGLSALYPFRIRDSVDAVVAVSFLLPLSLSLLGWHLWRRQRQLFCWFAFFFIGLLPVSQIVPIVTVMNDRYLYFPMLGAAPFVCGCVATLVRVAGRRTTLVVTAACCVALSLLPWLTVKRAEVWQNTLALWQDTAAKAPESKMAWLYLGEEYARSGNVDGALEAYQKALKCDPHDRKALRMAGFLWMKKGDLLRGRECLERAVREYPDDLEMYFILADNYRLSGDRESAAAVCRAALAKNPESERGKACLENVLQ